VRKFIIGILVSNQFGVLTRVSGLFARRGFNIDSLTVGETENPEFSRMTVTMTGDDYAREQMIKQLSKLNDVKEIKEMNPERSVSRELIILKVRTNNGNRQEIMDAVNVFRYKIIDYSAESVCIEMTGETNKLEAFVDLMRPYGIIEMCRTGLISMDRGTTTLKTDKV
jgi:acetolactate synthase-1/3 small subunit